MCIESVLFPSRHRNRTKKVGKATKTKRNKKVKTATRNERKANGSREAQRNLQQVDGVCVFDPVKFPTIKLGELVPNNIVKSDRGKECFGPGNITRYKDDLGTVNLRRVSLQL